jgi:nicotinamide-nucleotide amidase
MHGDTDEQVLTDLAVQAGQALHRRGWTLVVAESCTGGWVAQAVTEVAGSSAWFDRGFVTYSNAAKQEMLGVAEATLTQHGAVSEATAREMAEGALRRGHGDVGVAVTGIAGPAGGTAAKPVGMVCFAWTTRGTTVSRTERFHGDRRAIRRQAVVCALRGLLDVVAG